MKIKYLIVLIFFLPFIVNAKVPSEKRCTTNRDCILVQASCCDCNNGGKKEAINRNFQENRNNEMKKKCEGMMCPAYISQDKSCAASAIAVCKVGACQVSNNSKSVK